MLFGAIKTIKKLKLYLQLIYSSDLLHKNIMFF